MRLETVALESTLHYIEILMMLVLRSVLISALLKFKEIICILLIS